MQKSNFTITWNFPYLTFTQMIENNFGRLYVTLLKEIAALLQFHLSIPIRSLVKTTSVFQPKIRLNCYTPDIRSMWGYIVFAFPFVRSSVRSFVRTFVRSFVRSYVRSFVRLSVTGSKFLR